MTATGVSVLQGPIYECARCHTSVRLEELEALPSPGCGNCGFSVFAKARGQVVVAKQLKAV